VNRSQSNLQELDELITTRFCGILIWVDRTGSRLPIVKRNIGLAVLKLYKLDDGIRCIYIEDTISDEDSDFRYYLADAFMSKRDLSGQDRWRISTNRSRSGGKRCSDSR